MEAAGLLDRQRDERDERKVWVQPTAKAWGLRPQVLAVRREVVDRLPLSEPQIAQLRDLLQKMIADLEASET